MNPAVVVLLLFTSHPSPSSRDGQAEPCEDKPDGTLAGRSCGAIRFTVGGVVLRIVAGGKTSPAAGAVLKTPRTEFRSDQQGRFSGPIESSVSDLKTCKDGKTVITRYVAPVTVEVSAPGCDSSAITTTGDPSNIEVRLQCHY